MHAKTSILIELVQFSAYPHLKLLTHQGAQLVEGMQKLHVYKVGTMLFTGPNPDDETQGHVLPGIRHSIVIYYGPPRASNTLRPSH